VCSALTVLVAQSLLQFVVFFMLPARRAAGVQFWAREMGLSLVAWSFSHCRHISNRIICVVRRALMNVPWLLPGFKAGRYQPRINRWAAAPSRVECLEAQTYIRELWTGSAVIKTRQENSSPIGFICRKLLFISGLHLLRLFMVFPSHCLFCSSSSKFIFLIILLVHAMYR
jgi:hypothetical protein